MLRRADPRWAYVLVNVATLIWASNIALGRSLRDEIGPSTLSAARFVIAGFVFLVLLLSSKRKLNSRPLQKSQSPGGQWLWLLGMGLCGIFGFTTLLYLALRYTTASHAALINAASPLITAGLATAFLKEHFTTGLVAGSCLSLLGVVLVIGVAPNNPAETPQALLGDLLCLLAATLWGVYSILSRMATRLNTSLEATAYSIWLALPLLLLAAWVEWQKSPPSLTLPVLLATVYIGVFPSVVAYLAWNEGVLRAGPNQAMAFYNMLPVYGALLGVFALGEDIGWPALLGGGMVIAGGLIVVKSRKD